MIDPNGLFAGFVSIGMSTLNSLSIRISNAQTSIAAGGGSIFMLRGLERMQQLVSFLMQRGHTIVAYENRIVDATGNMIGRFRIDVIIQRVTTRGEVNTLIEQKGMRWDIMAQQGNAWNSYETQLLHQATAFSRATQTVPIQNSAGIPIHERIIVFTSKIPPNFQSKANISIGIEQYSDHDISVKTIKKSLDIQLASWKLYLK
jgi:hypothetical protein